MGLAVTKLSIDEWIFLTHNTDMDCPIPITLHSTSGSMSPFIRVNVDTVEVVPCGMKDVGIGDVILMKTNNSDAKVLLHRLYKIKNGKLITLGDNLYYPDDENDAANLLGRAVTVIGPDKNIDCGSPLRKLQGKLIVRSFNLRPFIFICRKVLKKLCRISGLCNCQYYG